MNIEDTEEWQAWDAAMRRHTEVGADLLRAIHRSKQPTILPESGRSSDAHAHLAVCEERLFRRRAELAQAALAQAASPVTAAALEAHTAALTRYAKSNEETTAALKATLARLVRLESEVRGGGFDIVLGEKS